MKKIALCLFMLVTAIATISCSSDDNKTETIQTKSKFEGTWTGTYSGADSGTWTATIDQNGEFVGQTNSIAASAIFVMKGSISDSGILNANFYTNSTIVGDFKGNLSNNSGNGTWTNTAFNISGTWKGTKN